MEIDRDCKRTIEKKYFICHFWLAVHLGIIDSICCDDAINRNRHQNKRRQMSDSVGKKRMQTTYDNRPISDHDPSVRNQNNIAKAQNQHAHVHQGQQAQINVGGIFLHFILIKYKNRKYVAEHADCEYDYG